MNMLLVRYTPTCISVYFITKEREAQEAFFVQRFSSKEITKLLVPTIQTILQEQHVSLDKLTHIAATVGPAPAFAHRSILAAINGIKTARMLEHKELFLYAIDDFLLIHEWYQHTYPESYVVSLYNAFSQELFYLYTKNSEIQRGIWQEKEMLAELQNCAQHNLIIIGSLSENQKQLLKNANIPYALDQEISEDDFCSKTLKKIDILEPVPFLFPHYTKLHLVEKHSALKHSVEKKL